MNHTQKTLLRVTTALGAAIILAEAFALGCNALLGNEAGTLEQVDAAAAVVTCDAGQKECAGTCVSTSDPQVGCGGACTICSAETNASSTCVLENDTETCALGSCNPQYGNCDNDASDGCETHTTSAANCGSCGAQCDPTQPYCEPSNGGASTYKCSAVCDYSVCPNGTDAGACIDLLNDTENCGKCGTKCTIAHGSGGACDDGGCDFKCDDGYFYCGGRCVLPSNAMCGPTCTRCGVGYSCSTNAATYGMCEPNAPPADAGSGGCTLSSDCPGSKICCGGTCTAPDDDHCGPSCTDCIGTLGAGATCVNAQCDAPPPTCTEPYNCTSTDTTTQQCGCTSGSSCNVSPDFSSNATCGDCATSCLDDVACCCPSVATSIDGGFAPAYQCSGTPNTDDGGCGCASKIVP